MHEPRDRATRRFDQGGGFTNAGSFACQALLKSRLHRFIGVIYRLESELMSHYAESVLPRQYDAFVWFEATSAVTPLGDQHAKLGAPDTYPFGL